VQARRVLLLFAVGLLLATAAASLVPVPQDAEQTESEQPEPTTEDTGSPEDERIQVRFSATARSGDDEPRVRAEEGPSPQGHGQPPAQSETGEDDAADEADARERSTETVPSGERVIVRVSASAPGQASIEGLGLIEPVGPRTPVVFDLFTDQPGEFEVLYTPVDGPPRRLGTLAIVEDGAAGDDR
jgi:hypothetical protein